MKCKNTETMILLAQSGELSWLKRRLLRGHLARCERCRQYQASLNQITTATRSLDPDAEVDEAVLERIRKAARREISRSREFAWKPGRQSAFDLFRPALVYSAVGLLLIGAFLILVRPRVSTVQTAQIPPPSVETPQPVEPPQIAETAKPATESAQLGWDDGLDNQISELGSTLAKASGSGDWSQTEQVTESSEEDQDENSIATELLQLEGEQI